MPTGTRVRGLLQNLGFSSPDPFDINDAEREGVSNLDIYFFEHPIFPDLLGNPDRPESMITFAERGSGKTTIRRAIERRCRHGEEPMKDVLAVSYTDFGDVLKRVENEGIYPSISDHVSEILRCAVRELITSIDETRIKRFQALGSDYRSLLRAYIDRFSTILTPGDRGKTANHILREIAKNLGVTVEFNASTLFIRPNKGKSVGFRPPHPTPPAPDTQGIIAKLPPLIQPIAALLVSLQEQEPVSLEGKGYTRLLEDFVDLLKELKFRAMYVLVDRIDEPSLLQASEDAARFINPITSDQYVLDMEGIAFRIFLPEHLRPLIHYRSKRVAVEHLVWGIDDLLDLLAKRIRSFSRHTSMRVFFDPPLRDNIEDNSTSSRHRRVYYVDLALVKSAHGLPRDLILRCRNLLNRYETNDHLGLLDQTNLATAAAADLGNDEPRPSDHNSSPPEPAGRSAPPTSRNAVPPAASRIPSPPANPPPLPAASETRQLGLRIDDNGYVLRDGKPLKEALPDTEFRLLKYLCEHRHQICPNDDILAAVWGGGYAAEVLRTTIKRLRQMVEHKDKGRPPFIKNHRTRGYQLTDGE